MCVIIHKQKDHKEIPPHLLKNAIESNPHGIGWVQFDHETKKIYSGRKYYKDGKTREQEIKKKATSLLNVRKSVEVFLHLRYTTKGSTELKNCHPFKITTQKDGKAIWFMHNGTINLEGEDTDISDSRLFAEFILRPLFKDSLKKHPNVNPFDVPHIESLIENIRTANSKFAFIAEDGTYKKFGTWCNLPFGHTSNNSYFQTARYSKSNTYHNTQYNDWNKQNNTYKLPDRSKTFSRGDFIWFEAIVDSNGLIPEAEKEKNQKYLSTSTDVFWKDMCKFGSRKFIGTENQTTIH